MEEFEALGVQFLRQDRNPRYIACWTRQARGKSCLDRINSDDSYDGNTARGVSSRASGRRALGDYRRKGTFPLANKLCGHAGKQINVVASEPVVPDQIASIDVAEAGQPLAQGGAVGSHVGGRPCRRREHRDVEHMVLRPRGRGEYCHRRTCEPANELPPSCMSRKEHAHSITSSARARSEAGRSPRPPGEEKRGRTA